MFEGRQKRIRRWHERRVLLPVSIQLEHAGSGRFFLQTLEARWSGSRRKWLWRMPVDHAASEFAT